jgi:acyl-coenzyme A synthetase/AMP-(fatty) acid ligase
LLEHPAVLSCALIGVDQGGGILSTRAYVQLRTGHAASDALGAALQEHVKARLTRHKYPREVRFVEDLPRNDRGKIDRKAIKALAAEEPR